MLDELLNNLNRWIADAPALALLGMLLWGVCSVVFSPCHLASIPLIIGYVGGQEAHTTTRRAAFYAALFSLGLFVMIAVVGVVSAPVGRPVSRRRQAPAGARSRARAARARCRLIGMFS